MFIVEYAILTNTAEAASFVNIVARARVPLAVSEDVQIVMFRAEIGGEEHLLR